MADGESLRQIRQLDYVWVPMSDGARLAARVWLPVDADDRPVPAILEAIPYRLSDAMAPRDALIHPYWAQHGYACVRLDLRGSGESDGLLADEYEPQEQRDLVEVIRWLSGQPWCTGDVGMTGISWGGFNSLQLAALRPPGLKAIVTLMSTDDRYADDVHYKGGCVLATDMLHWSTSMLHEQAKPPHEVAVGEGWRELWRRRLEANRPWAHQWLAHQRRDGYWEHGSVCQDYGAIQAAVYVVGGWIDGYTDSVLRLLRGLECPRKGLIGPWPHSFPHLATPGPRIGFLRETLRWWDHWLKGVDTGIMDEPMLRVWLQDYAPPTPFVDEQPGRWVAEDDWPSPRIRPQAWRLGGDGSLRPTAENRAGETTRPAGEAGPAALSITGSLWCGADAGAWCAEGQVTDWAPDQREAEGLSLCFTSDSLDEPLELLGGPALILRIAADKPLALVSARLDDVAPGGVSRIVTQTVFNLAHRESSARPDPLEPGRFYDVRFALDDIAQRVPAGHRLRLALSPTYWPWAWPSPETVTLTLNTDRTCVLELPVRPQREADAALAPFAAPEAPPGLGEQYAGPVDSAGRPDEGGRSYSRDLATGEQVWRFRWYPGGVVRLPNGWETEDVNTVSYAVVEGDPLSARVWVDCESVLQRGAQGTFRIVTHGEMTCDATTFFVDDTQTVYEGEDEERREVFGRSWHEAIPRDCV